MPETHSLDHRFFYLLQDQQRSVDNTSYAESFRGFRVLGLRFRGARVKGYEQQHRAVNLASHPRSGRGSR